MRFPSLPWLQQILLNKPSRLPRAAPQTLVPRRILTSSTASRVPIDVPKLIVAPGSTKHNSLATFLAYADRRKLDRASTTFVGTHYEYTVSDSLRRVGFSLFRTGGKSDRGIDLIGHWALPSLHEPIPVIVQCKCLVMPGSPAQIRELEGALQGVPPHWRNKSVMGILVTNHNATPGSLHRLGESRLPLACFKVSRDGTVEACWFNEAAENRGLEGVGVASRYIPIVKRNTTGDEADPDLPKFSNGRHKRREDKLVAGGAKKDIQMTFMGTPIFFEVDPQNPETVKMMDVLAHDSQELTPKRAKKNPVEREKTSRAGLKSAKKSNVTTPAKQSSKANLFTPLEATAPNPLPTPKPRGRPKGSKNKPK